MTIDTTALRKSHVDGWRPRQSVEIDVETLRALLDEVDLSRRLLADLRDEGVLELCEACSSPDVSCHDVEGVPLCAPCAAIGRGEEGV